MQPQRRLQILRFIAQYSRAPGNCTSADMSRMSGLVKFHAWPQMSLTRAGWAEVDRLSKEAATKAGRVTA